MATEVRVEDGIGQLGLAGGEAAACVAPAVKGGGGASSPYRFWGFKFLHFQRTNF